MMKVVLKFYRRDASLPSPPQSRDDPGLPYPQVVDVAAIPERGARHRFGEKDREVIMVTTFSNVAPGDPVAEVLVE